MALICGIDGRPVSSLRGLFAWVISVGISQRVTSSATPMESRRTPTPACYHQTHNAQSGLDFGSFATHGFSRTRMIAARSVALPISNTAKIIREILQDPATGVHLKIAALEAIANSTENIGLNAIIRGMVSEKNDNAWIRSTALRAFTRICPKRLAAVKALSMLNLSKQLMISSVTEVRVELLRVTRAHGSLPQHYSRSWNGLLLPRRKGEFLADFGRLLALPSDGDLDEILDGASGVLMPKNEDRFEVQSILDDEFLKRRLDILYADHGRAAGQLASQHTRRPRPSSPGTLASLKARFEQEPSLFHKVIRTAANVLPNQDRSFSLFLAVDLWKLLPATVWPVSPMRIFLSIGRETQ